MTLPTKPQPPSRHHRTLGSPTHAAPGQAMGLQRTRTQPHKDATGDNRRRTRRPLRATRPQSLHHRRQCQWGEPEPARMGASAAHAHKLLNQATVPKHHPRSATREVEAPGPSGNWAHAARQPQPRGDRPAASAAVLCWRWTACNPRHPASAARDPHQRVIQKLRGYKFRPCGADRGLLSVVVNFPPRPSLIHWSWSSNCLFSNRKRGKDVAPPICDQRPLSL